MRNALLALVGLLMIAPGTAAAVPGAEMRAELARLEAVRAGPVAAEDLVGQVVVVVFFASWCPPCRDEFPALDAVQRAYRGAGLRIVAVNVFETWGGLSTPERLARFLDEMQPQFPILRGDRAIRQTFDGLDRIPSLFVFDRAGRVVHRFVHERAATRTHLTEAELRAMVEPLL